jgi:hypothetical protein
MKSDTEIRRRLREERDKIRSKKDRDKWFEKLNEHEKKLLNKNKKK